MFDVEYGEKSPTRPASGAPKRGEVLARSVLEKLASDAKAASENAVAKWHKEEEEKLAARIVDRSKTAFSRFIALIIGQGIAKTQVDALRLAKDEIADYPRFMTCWHFNDAILVSSRWLAIVTKANYIDDFEVPSRDFEIMLDALGSV